MHSVDTLNICMKEFSSQKLIIDKCMKEFGSLKCIIDKMATMRTLTFFQAFLNKKVLCLFYDSAYMCRSTPTTAFDGAI